MQYTCITASERYVALGANTGGVYCFHRDGLKYIRILANRVSRLDTLLGVWRLMYFSRVLAILWSFCDV